MCSAECTLCPNTADRKNSKYYALADITLLRFDARAFAHTYVYMLRATGTQEIKSERYHDLVSRASRIFPRMRMRVRKWAGEGKEKYLPFPRPLSHAHAHTRKNTAGPGRRAGSRD